MRLIKRCFKQNANISRDIINETDLANHLAGQQTHSFRRKFASKYHELMIGIVIHIFLAYLRKARINNGRKELRYIYQWQG
jgi:hypothetical protein